MEKKQLSDLSNGLIEYQDYYLLKNNNVYKVIIVKGNYDIIIQCRNYEINLNLKDFEKLCNISFNTINEAYDFIINLYEENKIRIK